MNVVVRGLNFLRAEPDFGLLVAGQAMGQAADGIAQAGFYAVLLLDPLQQDTPDRILYLFALTLLPYSVISPFLGVFVDRWSRRGLLVMTNVLRGALLITLPLWGPLLPGDLDLFAAILVLLGLGRLFLTTKGAALPAVLHEHQLLKGNAISGAVGMISALAGGAIGLAAVGVLDENVTFVAAGIGYGVAAAIAARISAPLAHGRASRRSLAHALTVVASQLWEGLRAIWSETRARLPLAGIFLLRTVGILVVVVAILLVRRQFPGEAGSFGRLSASALGLGAAGAGAFLGAVTAPALGRRFDKPRLILVGFLISGVVVAAIGGIQHLVAIVAVMFVGSFGGFVTKVATDAQVQEALPDEYRGRAFALYDILYNLASVVAAAVLVVVATASLRLVLAVTGVVTLALAAGLAALMARAGLLTPTAARREAR